MRLHLKILIAALFACLALASPAQAASTWYASPNGSGTTCSQQSPCQIDVALRTLPPADGDTVVLAGGDYAIPANQDVNKRISIEGATSGQRSRLVGGGGSNLTLNYIGSAAAIPVHITDVDVTNQAGAAGAALLVTQLGAAPMVIDRVRGDANGTGGVGITVTQNATSPILLRNAIGRATAQNGVGIRVNGPSTGTGSIDVRNVVADGRGDGSSGFQAIGRGVAFIECGNLTVTLKNSYMRSANDPIFDLVAVGYFAMSQCLAAVQSSNSNYRDKQGQLGGTITPTNDQTADALFANAAAGDYHELAGSPTIDAGVIDDQVGPLDYYGSPRVANGKIDIGAAEFQPPPVTPDTSAPTGSAMAFKPTSFLPTAKAPAAGLAKKKAKRGTTLSYRVNEAATVVFTVERKLKGRKQGKKCKAKRKRGKRCTIFKSVKGSVSRASVAGANSFSFSGWIGGRKLKPGSYRMKGLPSDAAGNKGAVFTGNFKIKRG